MRTREGPLFTLNEAAVLTHLSLKVVHNAVDKRIVMPVGGVRAGHHRRALVRTLVVGGGEGRGAAPGRRSARRGP